MKKKLCTIIFLGMVLQGSGQFVQQPLNYPGTGYWPYYISITDPQHVWIGTFHEFGLPYSYARRTANSGQSWSTSYIPVPGTPICTSISAIDSNSCFYVFTDLNLGGGSIWKTMDGGGSWSILTTTQFNGGFANFYHAFSADTGIAMGDPTSGYFEIQATNDGGASWERIASNDIPLPLAGEAGISGNYSSIGNSVWFATNKGRCFRSEDKGKHWIVTTVASPPDGLFDVCFSTPLKGAFWRGDAVSPEVYLTFNGGADWRAATFPAGYSVTKMSRVPGFDGGFVITAWKSYMDVYFTPDMFSSFIKIGSNLMSTGAVSFYDAMTGWLSGGENGVNEILKYTGVLSSVPEGKKAEQELRIIPNPTVSFALLELPSLAASENAEIRVLDLNGKQLSRSEKKQYAEWIPLDASALKNGVYIIEVLSAKKLLGRGKWVINH